MFRFRETLLVCRFIIMFRGLEKVCNYGPLLFDSANSIKSFSFLYVYKATALAATQHTKQTEEGKVLKEEITTHQVCFS